MALVGYKNNSARAYQNMAIQQALAAAVDAIRDEAVTRTGSDKQARLDAVQDLAKAVWDYALARHI